MMRFSRLWWATILLSSVVTGGGTLVLLVVFTDLSIEAVVKISVAAIVVGDVILALIMETLAPTQISVGPGERRQKHDPLTEEGTVVTNFENGHGTISIRGERWQARQAKLHCEKLEPGAMVRVIEREGLTLIIDAIADKKRA